jgi:hypothetical protein
MGASCSGGKSAWAAPRAPPRAGGPASGRAAPAGDGFAASSSYPCPLPVRNKYGRLLPLRAGGGSYAVPFSRALLDAARPHPRGARRTAAFHTLHRWRGRTGCARTSPLSAQQHWHWGEGGRGGGGGQGGQGGLRERRRPAPGHHDGGAFFSSPLSATRWGAQAARCWRSFRATLPSRPARSASTCTWGTSPWTTWASACQTAAAAARASPGSLLPPSPYQATVGPAAYAQRAGCRTGGAGGVH